MAPARVAILGGGSFGSVIARILGASVVDEAKVDAADGQPTFAPTVLWWVRRSALADEINSKRTNVSYLGPDVQLPPSLKATTSLVEAVSGAQIVVLAVPHEFLDELLPELHAAVPAGAQVVSLLKGLSYDERTHAVTPLTTHIRHSLGGLPVSVLAGPNIYREMALDEYAEATLGYAEDNGRGAELLQRLFSTRTFEVELVPDLSVPAASQTGKDGHHDPEH